LYYAGVWQKLDALYVFSAADEATALTNLVQNSYGATKVGSPTFATDAGYTGTNSATTPVDYINSNFDPTVGSPNFKTSSASLFVWKNTIPVSDNGGLIGIPPSNTYIGTPTSSHRFNYGIANVADNTGTFNMASNIGLFGVNLEDSTHGHAYLNGVASNQFTGTNTGFTSGQTVKILSDNGAGTSSQVSVAGCGSSLTGADWRNLYSAVNNYMADIIGCGTIPQRGFSSDIINDGANNESPGMCRLAAPDNRLFMAYSTGGSGGLDAYVAYRTSSDNGVTWSGPITIMTPASGRTLIDIEVMVSTAKTVLLTFNDQPNSGATATPYVIRGTVHGDLSITWGSRIAISSGTNKDTTSVILQLANGTLMCPYYVFTGSTGTYVAFSADDGLTWGGDVQITSNGTGDDWSESNFIQFSNGIIYGIIRNDNGGTPSRKGYWRTSSKDNGATWAIPVQIFNNTIAPEPARPALLREPNGDLFFVSRFASVSNTPNTSVGYVYSHDGGITWSTPITIYTIGQFFTGSYVYSQGFYDASTQTLMYAIAVGDFNAAQIVFQQFIPLSISATLPSPQSLQFLNRLATYPDTNRAAAYSTLIDGLYADGVWSKIDILNIYAAADTATALTNLIQSSFNSSVVGSLTFTTNSGYVGSGTNSSYINTTFNPTVGTPNFALNSASVFAWRATAPGGDNGLLLGTSLDDKNYIQVYTPGPRYQWACNAGDSSTSSLEPTGLVTKTGLFGATRVASNSVYGYYAGIPLLHSTGAASMPSEVFRTVGSGASASSVTTSTVSAISIGRGMTGADVRNLNVYIQNYLNDIFSIRPEIRFGYTSDAVNDGANNYGAGLGRLLDGRLLCTYHIGDGTGISANLVFRTSSDNGLTWSAATTILTPTTGRSFDYGRVAVLTDGTILVSYVDQLNSGSNNTAKIVKGIVNNDLSITWSALATITSGVFADAAPCGPALRLQNGNLLIGLTALNDAITVVTSSDNGATWGNEHIVTSASGKRFGFMAFVQKANGNIFGVLRGDSLTTADKGYWTTVSTDNGATWSSPIQIFNNTHVPLPSEASLIITPTGRLMFFGRFGAQQPAFSYSNDGGTTWSTESFYYSYNSTFTYGEIIETQGIYDTTTNSVLFGLGLGSFVPSGQITLQQFLPLVETATFTNVCSFNATGHVDHKIALVLPCSSAVAISFNVQHMATCHVTCTCGLSASGKEGELDQCSIICASNIHSSGQIVRNAFCDMTCECILIVLRLVNGTGGLIFGGCADIDVFYGYFAKYMVGSVVYDCRQARVGVLDKVAIKKVRIVNDAGLIMYVDTFNRNWNEYDLCTPSNALAIATAYLEEQVVDAERRAGRCSFTDPLPNIECGKQV
jgi:hypothetical protein